jgi:hypothetical protein
MTPTRTFLAPASLDENDRAIGALTATLTAR